MDKDGGEENKKGPKPNSNIRLPEETLGKVAVVEKRYGHTKTGAIIYLIELGFAYEESIEEMKRENADALIAETMRRLDRSYNRRAEGE